jgi:hypothetical protein
METSVAIAQATRLRIATLQTAMKAERNGRAVTVDEAINRAFDRSDQLAAIITAAYPPPAPETGR